MKQLFNIFCVAICLGVTVADLCPNHNFSCPSTATCCPVTGGDYACCPFFKAVCCVDNMHCCPSGTVCNLERLTCDGTHLKIPFAWMVSNYNAKVVSLSIDVAVEEKKPSVVETPVEAPKEHTECGFGYCKEPNSVCCFGAFCCPAETECTNSFLPECYLPHVSTESIKKTPKLHLPTKTVEEAPVFHIPAIFSVRPFEVNKPVVCPDEKESCQAGHTCCLMENLSYGCCPLPQATCCDDRRTCCPNGYVCGTGNECVRKAYVNFFFNDKFISKTPIKKNC